jgi:ubiquinone/menaquinone biosynthesis C-methylase UbiE
VSFIESLGVLSDPVRVRLLHLLSRHELTVGDISRVVQLPQPTVSRHLKQLYHQEFVVRRTEGTSSFYRMVTEELSLGAGSLWSLVSQQIPPHDEDLRRLQAVLERRRMNSSQFFDEVAQRWEEVRRSLFGEAFVLPTLLTILPPGKIVADLGCGSGITINQLAPVTAKVIGVDREEAMLEIAAKRNIGYSNVELRQGRLDALPIKDAEVHLTLAMLVLHHVDDVAAAIVEMRRVIRPHGQAVILDMIPHDRREYSHSMGHQHFGFSESALEGYAAAADLRLASYRVLRPDPQADGPGLFVARLVPIN